MSILETMDTDAEGALYPTLLSPTYCQRPPRTAPRRPSSLERAQVRAQRELGAVARMVDAHPGVTIAALWVSTMAGLLLGAVLVRMGG